MQRFFGRPTAILIVVTLCFPLVARGADQDAARSDYFETHIRPLLLKHCAECHDEGSQEAGLRVDTRALVDVGGESGPAVVAGDPDASRLIQVVRYDGKIQMPPDGKLSDPELAMLESWVRDGAFWPGSPESADAATGTHSAGPTAQVDPQQHWAFQPVVPPVVPGVQDAEWASNAIDRFILAGLENQNLRPSPEATRRTLIRRLSYDLTGLPPDADSIANFEADDSPLAYENLVESLLASPRYGERWGRHWLDVARYADTKGYVGVGEGDLERREYPYAFAFRDWVIDALNQDLGYDQFLKRQIAADLMELEDQSSLAALGFFRVGRVFLGNKNDQIDDKIDAMTRGMLGLTVACARCHDHKFDPVPTADYYALFGIFASTDEPDDAENQRMLLADRENPGNARIFKRGNPATPGDEVPRRFLSVLAGDQPQPFTEGSGRRQLADAIATAGNPLTSRVIVNRVWAHHFGNSLVESPSDFGVRTPRPVHGDLLDYLAARLVANDWSLKELHREIVLSRTYRQTSDSRPECVMVDSENQLLWRQQRRRLDFEQMRDSMLAVGRSIDLAMGGPSCELTVEPFSHRRSVYGRVDRQNLPGMFRTFDFANPDSHSPGRYRTTVPQQGLFVMNHPLVIQCARDVAARVEGNGVDPSDQVAATYRTVLARNPDPMELQLGVEFLNSGNEVGVAELAQALIMTNEFMFLD
jgi:hypothetical protein